MEPIARFIMIGTAPELDKVFFGVDLERSRGYWHWWVPGRPHSFYGGDPIEEHDGWWRIPADDPQTFHDLWFKEYGIWVKPVTPGLRDATTDEEALAWVAERWDAEVRGGGW